MTERKGVYLHLDSPGTTEKLIREALENATPGPWTYDPFINGYGVKAGGYINQIAIATEKSGVNGGREWARNNAHLIANAPTWLKYLLEENEQLKSQSDNELQKLKLQLVEKVQTIDKRIKIRNGPCYFERSIRI